MAKQVLALLVATAILAVIPAVAQPATQLQDLSIQAVLGPVQSAGDMAMDSAGNLWLVATQGSPGWTANSLTKITPQGQVLPSIITGLGRIGDLIRGNDGKVYLWMEAAPSTATLMSIDPLGSTTIVGSYSGFQPGGIAQDAAGNFYLGSRQGVPGGIWMLAPGAASLTLFSTGLTSADQDHLAIDPVSGRFFVGHAQAIYEVIGPGAATLLYAPFQPACPGCGIDLPDFAAGYHGQILTAHRFSILNPGSSSSTTSLLSLRSQQSTTGVATLASGTSLASTALAAGLAGDYWAIDQGTLYHLSGNPALLGFAATVGGQVQVTVDAPAGSPLVLAIDTWGFAIPFPGLGIFHTSLGTAPTFGVLADGLGAFVPANPTDLAPWSATYPLPNPYLGIPITLEAYVLTPQAANGLFQISNHIDVQL